MFTGRSIINTTLKTNESQRNGYYSKTSTKPIYQVSGGQCKGQNKHTQTVDTAQYHQRKVKCYVLKMCAKIATVNI